MKRVYSSMDLVAIHHARNLLESAGIRATVKNEHLVSAMGELPPDVCQFELWVTHREEAVLAETVLRENRAAQPSGPPWRCHSCGETGEPQFSQCWQCGAERPDRQGPDVANL